MLIYFSRLADITGGSQLQLGQDSVIEFLITDSRKISSPANSVFFAIKGERHDGHRFINDVRAAGVKMFVVEDEAVAHLLTGDKMINVILVKHAISAMQALAAFKRQHYHIPVIGITGSNAKTIIKEWLSQLLYTDYSIVKSPKSYNSQLGVPLSVWQMNERHTLGIFEAGISKPNEMSAIADVIKPTIGLFTNIGTAHDEGFESKKQKVAEKALLFRHVEVVIYCAAHELIKQELSNSPAKSITWVCMGMADIIFEPQKNDSQPSVWKLAKSLKKIDEGYVFVIPFADKAMEENLFHCISVMLYLDISPEVIQKRINILKRVSMRLELKEGINNSYIIDDTYNNDLAGLTIALDFLHHQNQRIHKSVILSDLYETGMDPEALYRLIAKWLQGRGIHKIVCIGHELSRHKHLFESHVSFFDSTDEYLSSGMANLINNEIVLVKGARTFAFERIVQRLQKKFHRTVLEINLDALSHNLNYYKSKVKPDTKIMVMVKSFAYGAGSLEVANLLQFHRVDYLAVAYADEGILLREAGISIPIMIMNPSKEDFTSLAKFKLEPVVYSLGFLKQFVAFADSNEEILQIHLEIETGMNRLGLNEAELPIVVAQINSSSNIKIASVFSHLAGADEDQFYDYTHLQYNALLRASAYVEDSVKYKFIRHILNSAGIVRYPDLQLDMVRLGIGLYGIEANGKSQDQLQTVGTLKTTISQIKNVKAGETIGYGRKGKAKDAMRIAIIAIGYGDGYHRSFSNGVGKVLVNGNLAPVIGNVCMDMTMIDVTHAIAEEGDEVIVFGHQPTITQLASAIQTIPYEILTGVSERVKRVFYAE